MSKYKPSNYYKEIAEQVICSRKKLEFINEYNINIAYRTSTQEKKNGENLVFADCERVSDKNKMYMGYDFIITVYEPNVMDWDLNRIKVLMLHELSHIGAELTDDGVRTYIVQHDFADFFDIYNEFGIGWEANPDLPDICN